MIPDVRKEATTCRTVSKLFQHQLMDVTITIQVQRDIVSLVQHGIQRQSTTRTTHPITQPNTRDL